MANDPNVDSFIGVTRELSHWKESIGRNGQGWIMDQVDTGKSMFGPHAMNMRGMVEVLQRADVLISGSANEEERRLLRKLQKDVRLSAEAVVDEVVRRRDGTGRTTQWLYIAPASYFQNLTTSCTIVE